MDSRKLKSNTHMYCYTLWQHCRINTPGHIREQMCKTCVLAEEIKEQINEKPNTLMMLRLNIAKFFPN